MSTITLDKFEQWLIKNGITTSDKSAAVYKTKLRKAFNIWDSKSSFLTPIDQYLDQLKHLAQTHPVVLDDLINIMIGYVCDECVAGKIKKGYADDICTVIRRVEEYLKSSSQTLGSVQNSQISQIVSSATQTIKDLKEFYPQQLNLRSRIASRDSKYWPARKLGNLLGNSRAETWITKALKKVYVLTEAGPHRVIDIEKMRIGQGDILEVKPAIYQKGSFVRAYGYHANGSIHPLKVARDSNGVISLSSISLDHSPAISLIIKSGQFPEFMNLINGKTVNPGVLKKEFDLINEMELYLLMGLRENTAKGNRW